MSNFDYFKQYQSEMNRIKKRIEEEENPYHRQHIQEFSDMVDEKIRKQLPAMIQQYNEKQRVELEMYLNGKRVKNNDIGAAIRKALSNAFKRF